MSQTCAFGRGRPKELKQVSSRLVPNPGSLCKVRTCHRPVLWVKGGKKGLNSIGFRLLQWKSARGQNVSLISALVLGGYKNV